LKLARLFRAVAAALVLSGAAAPLAHAAKPTDELAGDWLLETSDFDLNCHITGTINFRPTSVPGVYSCAFTSEQICKSEGVEDRYIKVRQTCAAQKVGKQVAIKSKVARLLEHRGFDYEPGYWADNFIVTLTDNALEMVGQHYDEQRQLKARFWRDRDLLSWLFPRRDEKQSG
jgi:hypothetical protein